ncbi:terminase large subunit [Gordonia phage Banquo]|uniref:Terminase large subunit n=1 Tax=Gordonia phage TinaLin TaxID=2797324 RepID=A0A7T7GTC3_9CAUD|nr:terminase large subunit [Gordonia phage TinaLin]QQM15099.1 terminase large subunit [Gordonia phage TinaLin]URM87342.1 terminase large subunit [Gordonia phage Banquo]
MESAIDAPPAGAQSSDSRDAALDDPSLLAVDLRDDAGVLKGIATPRIFTPPRRELTPETSLGFECIEFARDVLGIELFPWQQWLLIHALELNDDGTFRFRKVVVLVARQQGKTTLFKVWALWRLYADDAEAVMGTAQDLSTAEKTMSQTLALADSVPDLKAGIAQRSNVNGSKFFRLANDPEHGFAGGEYIVKAATGGGGRGSSIELVFMDELREHKNHLSYSAVSKTTNAIPRAQVVMMSNAGDESSVVLNQLQDAARAKIVAGQTDDTQTGLFEWSAPDGCNVWDRRGWAQANPSCGHGTISEKIIAGDCEADPEPVFRTEVLCQRVKQLERSLFETEDGEDTWAGCAVELDAAGDFVTVLPDRDLDVGIEVSHNRSHASIVVAQRVAGGQAAVEVVARRVGTDWVIPWLTDPKRVGMFRRVAVQAKGSPASSLLDDLHRVNAAKVDADRDAGRVPEPHFDVVEWGGGDLAKAHGQFFDLVTNDPGAKFIHMNQPILNQAAATAKTKLLGASFVFDLAKSPEDVAPLIAAVAAVWLLTQGVEAPKQSAYDDDDAELMVLE